MKKKKKKTQKMIEIVETPMTMVTFYVSVYVFLRCMRFLNSLIIQLMEQCV